MILRDRIFLLYNVAMVEINLWYRVFVLSALVVACGVLGVGCGNSDDPPSPPTLEIAEGPVDSPEPLGSAAEVDLTVSVTSSKAGDLTYAWSSDCSSLPSNGTFSDAASQSPVWTAPENISGETQLCTVSVRVSNGDDLEATSTSTQSVASVPHTLTFTDGPVDSPEPLASSGDMALSVSATDSWGRTLSYLWSSECPALPANGTFSDETSSSPIWTAPENLSGEDEVCTIQIQVSDGEGLEETNSSTHVVAVAPIIPEPADEIAFMYNDPVVRTIELEMTPERLAFLDAQPAAEEYVEGSIIIDGVRYDGVGIRYKGSVGAFAFCTDSLNPLDPSGAKTCPKLSMKVKFNEFEPGQRFYGVKRLQFHAMNMDPGMLVERMSYKLFREMGVVAPRTAYIRLVINGEFVGIHLLVEQIDGQLVRSRFSEGGKGNLYKEAWPITDSADFYLASLRTNRDEDPSAEKMVGFYQDLEADADSAILKWLDIDYTMAYFAVDRAIKHDDGVQHFYCYGGSAELCRNHNFFWYEEEEADRHWLIPWDMDNAAFGNHFNFVAVPGDWRDENPSCVPEAGLIPFLPPAISPACDPLIHALAGYPDLYREKQQELLDGYFSQAVVESWVDEWADLIRAEVASAHAYEAVHVAPAQWEAQIADFKLSLSRAREALAGDIAGSQPE